MRNRPVNCALLIASLGLSGWFSAHAVTLVENGQPRAVIVVTEPVGPTVRLAAQILHDHLKQISGADLPIQREADAHAQPARILVGEDKTLAPGRISGYERTETRST